MISVFHRIFTANVICCPPACHQSGCRVLSVKYYWQPSPKLFQNYSPSPRVFSSIFHLCLLSINTTLEAMAGCPPLPTSFSCFHMNCYRKFPTEKGLRQHTWANEACKRYMSSGLMYASSSEIVDDQSQRRSGCKTKYMRLNPTMCTDAPSYSPYNKFLDYDEFFAGSFDTDNDDVLLPAPKVDMDPAVDTLYSVPAAQVDE